MDRAEVKKAVEEVLSKATKKKFTQSIDLAINLKFESKESPKIDEIITVPKGKGKPAKVGAFVAAELKDQAEKLCDKTAFSDTFDQWKEPRKIKKFLRSCDFFIAQATIMPKVAQVFGKYLGPIGKMPNPKAGQLVPPKANLEPLVKKLKNSVKLTLKKSPVLHCSVGNEKMSSDDISENIVAILEALKSKLPKGAHTISSIYIKTTMGPGVKIQ
jgi:large subunit ribosomal protein L1